MILIAGPCVIDKQTAAIADQMAEIFSRQADFFDCYFKASYDKANRSSLKSYRGPGLTNGLKILSRIKKKTGMKLTTDVHREQDMERVAAVVDMVQIPALLCRQTDLLVAAATCGRPVNIKKGQFMAPWDMGNAAEKLEQSGCRNDIYITERGTSFGYNRLIVDILSVPILQKMGRKVILDCTHSLQLPAAGTGCSASLPRGFARTLALAAAGVNVDGLFFEVYPNPNDALCDGPNSLYIKDVEPLLQEVRAIWQTLNRHRHHLTDETPDQ